jgi:hypothetical protein
MGLGTMPNRILRESILTSEAVNSLPPAAELFYRRLMSVVDDYGRYDGRPSIIRAACYPLQLAAVREANVQRWIALCVTAGLVRPYEANGKPFVVLLKLGEPRAKSSKYPDPPDPALTCAHMSAHAPALRLSSSYSPAPIAAGAGGMAGKRKEVLQKIGGTK